MENVMSGSVPKISICITTFNRVIYLKEVLGSIIRQNKFMHSHDVEIVVSDNCSEDETSLIVQELIELYPGKIVYNRNPENIGGDLNAEAALRAAHGELLILHNDNFPFIEGAIDYLCALYDKVCSEKPIIFLSNNFHNKGNGFEVFVGHDEFVKNLSYLSGWFSAFTIWSDDLKTIKDFSRKAETQLVTTDVMFRLIDDHRKILSINTQLFYNTDVGPKGGYSIVKVYAINYINFLKELLSDNKISQKTFEKEKKKVFFDHIIHYYLNINHNFSKFPFMAEMYEYWGESYFQNLLDEIIKSVINNNEFKLSKISDSEDIFKIKDIGQIWKDRNSHNETTMGRVFDISKVEVGNHSYGVLNVWTWDNVDERLKIGNFASIADNVNFLLGGNHKYDSVSNYPFEAKMGGAKINQALTKGPIIVHDDVWFGYGATIHSGVEIGQGAIIAANAVVVKNVEPYSIVAGNPAKQVKKRFEPEVIEKLLQIDYSKIDKKFIEENIELFIHKFKLSNLEKYPKIIINLNGS